ncbi:recombinase RecT [Serratia liquefaciens]|uniref:recombinase RecT n=1 Tax=Serratia liquefaciens TaxID=614 RepID=UPI00235F8B80|nr:recombinase RecT [Serratia liquefaciens]
MTNQLALIQKDLAAELAPAKEILPSHVSFEKFTTAAAVALANNSDLLGADRQSVINALSSCAKDGLIPDNREAALIVYKTKNANGQWIPKAQYLPMIDGVMKRARQSGEVSVIATRAWYKNDQFRVWMDEDGEHIFYEPNLLDRGELVGTFAYAKMKSGELQFEVMNLDDIEKVRAASKNSDKGPWVDWYESMARKSVMHRLCRRLPNNSEMMEMLERGTEMVWQKEKDITPDTRVTTGQLIEAADQAPEPAPDVTAPETMAADIRGSIEKITTPAQATDLRASVEELKSQLGITLYTELKNKIVKQHHRLNAISALGASIDEAGRNGGTTIQERAELGALLQRSERFLTADEVQRYQQAIDDLSPAQEATC